MSNSPNSALALAQHILEAEGGSAKDFIMRFRPPPNWNPNATGNDKPIGEYSLDDYGIENNQYWQGVSMVHTNWDAVYTGIGDDAAEAAADAIGQAAENGWATDTIVNEIQGGESVSSYILDLAKTECRSEIHEEDYETPEEFEEALTTAAEEMIEEGGWEDLQYYVVLWVREFGPQDVEQQESLHEAEGSAKAFIMAQHPEPRGWPAIKRWQHYIRATPGNPDEVFRRRAFVGKNQTLRNTWFIKEPSQQRHSIRLHSTNILRYRPNGDVSVYAAGWQTKLTRDRINTYAPNGWRIAARRGDWYWYNQGWPEAVRIQLWDEMRSRSRNRSRSRYWIAFNDGDTILRNGNLKYSDGAVSPTGEFVEPVAPQANLGEGRYLDKLAWIKRAKAKHAKMKEVRKRDRDLEKLKDRSKPKKNFLA